LFINLIAVPHRDSVIGDVADHAVIVDDMIDTGDTVCKAAEILVRHGVKKVYAAVTHGKKIKK
jgi:ribose-phosphate pyrophosphokinase